MGEGLAKALIEVTTSVNSPYEDVRGYLQNSVLPALGPSIEELLHHIHTTGELQRALRERADAERQARKQEAKNTAAKNADAPPTTPAEAQTPGSAAGPPPGSAGERKEPSTAASATPSVETTQQQESASNAAAPASAAPDDTEAGLTSETDEALTFDPLMWLSDHLRQSAAGSTSKYRDQIEESVRRQMEAAAAAAKATVEADEEAMEEFAKADA